MILRIHNIKAVVPTGISDALGTIESRRKRRASIPSIAALTSPRDALQALRRQVDLENRVAFSQYQVSIAIAITVDGAGAKQGSSLQRGLIWRRLSRSGPRQGRDDSGFATDMAQPMIANIADQQVVAGIKGNTVGAIQLA